MPRPAPFRSRVTLIVAAAALAACGEQAGSPGAGAAPPPPAVGVVTVMPQVVPLVQELPGRVEPVRTAQVRARVTGVVLERRFREGSEVRAGQPLFLIDAAPYRAALAGAEAQQARAEAQRAQAAATLNRYAPLAAERAISEQQLADTRAVLQAAEADVAAARAAVQSAQINLGHTQVTAPISGRIGRALVTEGALVSAVEATPLALIQQVQTVYVNFTQSASELLALRRSLDAGRSTRRSGNGGEGVAVQVLLDDGSALGETGRLLFSDLSVDATSGQVTLRAEVPNREGLLLPGQFVRVRLAQAELPAGVLLPQQAVTRSQAGDTVLVVGAENKPAPRPVQIAGSHQGQWVVTGGLQPGERVIVDGFQKMFVPGAPVNPVPWQAPGSASAPAAAASR